MQFRSFWPLCILRNIADKDLCIYVVTIRESRLLRRDVGVLVTNRVQQGGFSHNIYCILICNAVATTV